MGDNFKIDLDKYTKDEQHIISILLKENKRQQERLNKILKISDRQQFQVVKSNDALKEKLEKIEDKIKIELVDGYVWNRELRQLFKDDIQIKLSSYEILFLDCLSLDINQTVHYEDIHNYIYSVQEFSKSALSSIAKRIRQKTTKGIIKSCQNEGYKLIESAK